MAREPRDSEENNWGFGTEDPVNTLAGKMYGARVKAHKEEAAKYDIGAERLRKTFDAARAEADRSAAILLFALAEDLMLHGLKQHLQGEIKGGWDEVSSGNGLLATANDRITLLALLAWIHPVVYSDLRVLKAIRNRFAHHPDTIGFDEHKIRSHISALFPAKEAVLPTVGLSPDAVISPRQLYLARAGSALTRLVINLAVAPAARLDRVAPGHIDMVPWDQLPPNL
jgi:DNA-binding MltR family transcriptional regulator